MTEFLKKSEIFSGLEDDEFNLILKYFNSKDIEKNGVVFEFGEQGDELFIVVEGIISGTITLQSGRERVIEEFRPGDFFGEASLFEKLPRTSTCRALEESVLLSINEKDFSRFINDHPKMSIKFMLQLLNLTTQRLRISSRFLADIVQWGESERRRTIKDELTGVYNRRFFNDALVSHFNTSMSTGKPLSVVMLDLDCFTEINELFTEEIGDNILIRAASVFKESLRENDVIARYGGDEFVFILPGIDQDEAKNFAEKNRNKIKAIDFSTKNNDQSIKITISQGISSFPENADDPDSLKNKADSALYRAKEMGKNRIVCTEQKIKRII